MSAAIIQGKYDVLEQIAQQFSQLQSNKETMAQTLRGLVDQLQAEGGWQGEGADAFYNEMHHVVLPAVARLAQSFEAANSATAEVATVLKTAEEEAAAPFRTSSDGIDMVNTNLKGSAGIQISQFANPNLQANMPSPNFDGSGLEGVQLAQFTDANQQSDAPPQISVSPAAQSAESTSETAPKVPPLSQAEMRKTLDSLMSAPDISAHIQRLESQGALGRMIDQINLPQERFELMRLLGGKLDDNAKAAVLPHIQGLDNSAEMQFNLGALGLSQSKAAFDPTPYKDLIASEADPFTGVGATGINPQDKNIGLMDQYKLATKDEETLRKYGNPLPGSLSKYMNGLTADQRQKQVELLVNQPISSAYADSYAGNLPTRAEVITLAAKQHNLQPELVTSFILAEQRDQSALEDAKDFTGAISPFQANTSIGLGQVVVSTAQNNALFNDLFSTSTQAGLTHNQTATLLASDEVNIFATAKYIRQVADSGALVTPQTIPQTTSQGVTIASQTMSQTTASFPKIDFGAYAGHSSTWPRDNIRALASEYTSTPWDDRVFPGWGYFVNEAYQDTLDSKVYR